MYKKSDKWTRNSILLDQIIEQMCVHPALKKECVSVETI